MTDIVERLEAERNEAIDIAAKLLASDMATKETPQ
jgi:hypothetical protein